MIEGIAMGFVFHSMSEKVSKEPAAAAKLIKKHVEKGETCAQIAERYGVTLRTVGRWIARLREVLGADQLGFVLREGRRPGSRNAKKPEETSVPGKKARGPKKAVAICDNMA